MSHPHASSSLWCTGVFISHFACGCKIFYQHTMFRRNAGLLRFVQHKHRASLLTHQHGLHDGGISARTVHSEGHPDLRSELITTSPKSYYPPIKVTRVKEAPVLRVTEFVSIFKGYDFDQHPARLHPQLHTVQGRVTAIRKAGKGLYFVDLAQDFAKVQVVASHKLMGLPIAEFSEKHALLRRGDYVSCQGHASTTNVGELSLKLTDAVSLLVPCLRNNELPDKELVNRSTINANRVLNYLSSDMLRQRTVVRSHLGQAIRGFFLERNFLEFSTPLLASLGTGANAEPFSTSLKAVSEVSLQLRVAPELWLKKLVISGFDKVFEIGPSFRNEGVDATHNPEFHTCEFYQSFTSLLELMDITEGFFAHVFSNLAAKKEKLPLLETVLPQLSALQEGNFARFEFIPTLEKCTGVPLPQELDSESLIAYYRKVNAPLPEIKSPASLLDNLSSRFLESISMKPEYHNKPIFLHSQPAVLSALSKSTHVLYGTRKYEISLRFELFINGKEYVNSYEEENSPFEQTHKFQLQQANKMDFDDTDSLIPDWNYVKLMEYGLPPTGGWGCGIDRLAMLFTGSERIDEVLPFGNIRDVVRQ